MRHSRVSWIALVAILAITRSAAASVDWSGAFALASRGAATHPAVLVGFDPQPEPPAARGTVLDLSDRTAPLLILRDQSNPPGERQLFDFFLAVDIGQTIAIVPCFLPTDVEPRLELEVRADTATGPILFEIFADFSTSSGGLVDPGSVVGFDPQPDPPGEFGASFGLTLAFDRLSDVQVRFAMAPPDGAPLAFTQVPEPSALALLGLGVATCAVSRRSRRR